MGSTLLARLLPALLAAILVGGCAGVPFDGPRTESHAPDRALPGPVARAAGPWLDRPDGASGFVPFDRGTDALGARLALIDAAAHTIDVQYFLIKPDYAGALFVDRLIAAADRGVRVRFLVDDVFTSATDAQLGLLDRHPNAEVRIFNPVARSGPNALAFLRDFARTNRRMHNKSLTVDGAVTKVGGRNIANEYYGIGGGAAFADFDVLAAGPVALSVSREFDRFWNSRYSVPLAALAPQAVAGDADVAAVRAGLAPETLAEARQIYDEALASPVLGGLETGALRPVPGQARVVSDPPEKIAAPNGEGSTVLAEALVRELAKAEREVVLLTPYFVPGDAGVALLEALRTRGVAVTVITNSLASNNHPYVHGAYSRARDRLLAAGVSFYEARADSMPGGLTLHTKAAIIDRETVLVGSLNLDPRSFFLNTELGVFIDSPALAAELERKIRSDLPGHVYALRLEPDGRTAWLAEDGAETRIWHSDPGATVAQRIIAAVAGILPIEGQL